VLCQSRSVMLHPHWRPCESRARKVSVTLSSMLLCPASCIYARMVGSCQREWQSTTPAAEGTFGYVEYVARAKDARGDGRAVGVEDWKPARAEPRKSPITSQARGAPQ